MELASDPMGADFRPYMRQILQTIKRNWLAVYPEAARLGTRGEVVLLFRHRKGGTVAKVSFSDRIRRQSTRSGGGGCHQRFQSAAAAAEGIQRQPDCPAHDVQIQHATVTPGRSSISRIS